MSDEAVGAKAAARCSHIYLSRISPACACVACIDAAVAVERKQAALEEAARHADCCVDREERDTLRAQVDRTDREHRRVLGLLESALIREEGVREERDGQLAVAEQSRENAGKWLTAYQDAFSEARKLEADNARLREALAKYGAHLDQCAVQLAGNNCTCGLRALVA